MKKTLFWILSFIITVSFAYFQRITGPTYPIKTISQYKGASIKSYLPRSCTIGKSDCVIKVFSENEIEGNLIWRRYKSLDKYARSPMVYEAGVLKGFIKEQPPAGKVEYKVEIGAKADKILIAEKPVITRFKGFVPPHILVPHIVFMFLFMLFSVRIFLGIMDKKYILKHPVLLNVLFLGIGGFIFGPITQKYAFDFYWTGFPFGYDLTDNKTLVMMIFWLMAAVSLYKSKYSRRWIILAFMVTFAMYLIPHSLFGSEIDYRKQAEDHGLQAIGQKK